MLAIIAIVITVFAGFAFVAFNTPHGGESNPNSTTTNVTTDTTYSPIVHTSCSPSPCSSVSESTTTRNGTPYVIINETYTERLIVCTITAEGEIYLTVVNSSNSKPISGMHVQTTETSPALSPNCAEPYPTVSLGDKITNASGVISICCDVGSYNFTMTYNGENYNASALVYPEETTCIAMHVPSGMVNVTHSQPLSNVCSQ